ncbi:two-component system chemotaxis sensor kinase CheA [Rhodovulum imhoffii]|uniref:Chemotaxis protein CheA n=1 Tax=Rhodovulum imhoffii TaxID=365340 RepID=A0A2T5BRH2_9RHOB|nr:chemotaxis protein CheA [Rhodovulum imhoffii]MBK5934001.1 chemotaxis protein CheA [Rhodovulum imhoffii]PTN01886.1 two-component system chemotaxis sensor kinase CheA [Rhodovulum imhoffii]
MSSLQDTFFEECEELLLALDEGLGQVVSGAHDKETVNAVFRAVHSIKGGAGAFGFDDLVSFAHIFETVLDELRADRLSPDADLARVLYAASDRLAALVEATRDGTAADAAARDSVLADLNGYLGNAGQEEAFNFPTLTLDLEPLAAAPAEWYEIVFRPHDGLSANGHEPALMFAELAEMGEIGVVLDDSALPDWDGFDPEKSYLGWTISLCGPQTEPAVAAVFDFVEGLCDLEIRHIPAEDAPTPDSVPDLAVEVLPVETRPPGAPPPADLPDKARAEHQGGARPTLRVDLERVDRLINTVGELIINQAMISQRIHALDLPAGNPLENELEDYKLLARDIQEGIMAIRAQPVKPLFQRMARIVREASASTGKDVEFVTTGEATEIDKTLIERLADPLTHMIRNAVDHGLEPSDARTAAGKSAQGRITLSACHRSGSVFIEVSDDGAGLNREKILGAAVRKGLVSESADFSESEIDALLFLPGFSTAAEVSNLSGRGVGMDVVKRAVQDLGGRITISSVRGRGTTFTIVLPLTLAVLDGMVISVAGQTMVMPITAILETIRPEVQDLHSLGAEGQLLSIRGQYVPVVDVASSLGLTRPDRVNEEGVLILVETQTQERRAFAVDMVHDQRQVVIKSLEGNYGVVPGISAATILGDGKIALILDPDSTAQLSPRPTPMKEEA